MYCTTTIIINALTSSLLANVFTTILAISPNNDRGPSNAALLLISMADLATLSFLCAALHSRKRNSIESLVRAKPLLISAALFCALECAKLVIVTNGLYVVRASSHLNQWRVGTNIFFLLGFAALHHALYAKSPAFAFLTTAATQIAAALAGGIALAGLGLALPAVIGLSIMAALLMATSIVVTRVPTHFAHRFSLSSSLVAFASIALYLVAPYTAALTTATLIVQTSRNFFRCLSEVFPTLEGSHQELALILTLACVASIFIEV